MHQYCPILAWSAYYMLTLWTSGDVRCVLDTHLGPAMLVLQLFNGKDAVLSEPVADPDHAAIVADGLWLRFIRAAF